MFRVLANCSAQLPQSSLKLVCEASLRNKKNVIERYESYVFAHKRRSVVGIELIFR